MKNFQHNRGFRNIIYSRPVLVFLLVVLLFFAWGVVGLFGKMEITRENRKITENKVAGLEKDKEVFSAKIAKLDTSQGKEESIRERFSMGKEGEEVIRIVDNDSTPPAAKTESEGGFFSFLFFWRNWFK